MEYILFELATYLTGAVHAILSFVLWLAVITFTAAVLVFNRVSEGLMRAMSMEDTDEAANQNTFGAELADCRERNDDDGRVRVRARE